MKVKWIWGKARREMSDDSKRLYMEMVAFTADDGKDLREHPERRSADDAFVSNNFPFCWDSCYELEEYERREER